MSKSLFLSACCLAFCLRPACSGELDFPGGRLQIELNSDRDTITLGTPLLLRIDVTNVGTETVKLPNPVDPMFNAVRLSAKRSENDVYSNVPIEYKHVPVVAHGPILRPGEKHSGFVIVLTDVLGRLALPVPGSYLIKGGPVFAGWAKESQPIPVYVTEQNQGATVTQEMGRDLFLLSGFWFSAPSIPQTLRVRRRFGNLLAYQPFLLLAEASWSAREMMWWGRVPTYSPHETLEWFLDHDNPVWRGFALPQFAQQMTNPEWPGLFDPDTARRLVSEATVAQGMLGGAVRATLSKLEATRQPEIDTTLQAWRNSGRQALQESARTLDRKQSYVTIAEAVVKVCRSRPEGSVDALLDLIGKRLQTVGTGREPNAWNYYPYACGLIAFGGTGKKSEVSDAVVDRLKKEQSSLQKRLQAWVLMRLYGEEKAEEQLREAIAVDPKAEHRTRLEEAIFFVHQGDRVFNAIQPTE